MGTYDLDARQEDMTRMYSLADPEHWDEATSQFILQDKGDYYVGVMPLMFTAAVIIGERGKGWYVDRWCYHSVPAALAAAAAWTGEYPETEPEGWHRHPSSGRRREGGDPSVEEVRM